MRITLLLLFTLCGLSAGEVSKMLFGANLEFTRHDVFEGISSEVLSNRKFQSPYGQEGVPRWEMINGATTINSTYRRNGNSIRCNSTNCGIRQQTEGGGYNPGQEGGSAVTLKQGWSYAFRSVMRGGSASTVTVSVDNQTVAVISGMDATWGTFTKTFTFKEATTTSATFDISFDGLVDISAVSLTPLNNTQLQGLRTDVISALKTLRITGTYRYPGGCYSSVQAVNFTDTLLDPDMVPVVETPPNFCPAVHGGVNAYTDGFLTNGISTPTYVQLSEIIGSEKSITTRLVMGTPEENEVAADWLAYTEANKMNITHWYLGNEMNIQARFPGYPQDKTKYPPPSGEEYAQMAFDMSQAMLNRSASPSSLKFYAVSGNGEWLAALLKKPKFVHAVSFHGGYANEPGVWNPETATSAAKEPSNFYSSLISLRQTLNANNGSYVSISADEWGLGPPWKSAQFGTPHAMYAASMLATLMAAQEPAGVSAANYFEPINEGSLIVNPFSVEVTPVGQVQREYARHGGGTVEQLPNGTSTSDISLVRTSSPIAITVSNRNAVAAQTTTVTLPVTCSLVVRTYAATGFLPNSTFAVTTSTISVTKDVPFKISVPAYSVVAADPQ